MVNDTIGIHYERPDGQIAYTCGFNGIEKEVYYRLDDDKPVQTVSEAEFQTWKPRRDLSDFPNARDPRLPYVFDLFWDIKHVSELRRELPGHEEEAEIRAKMTELNIRV